MLNKVDNHDKISEKQHERWGITLTDKWEYVKNGENVDYTTIVGKDEELKVKFVLERQKDIETKLEQLTITCYKNDEDNGSIVTMFTSIKSDLYQFKNYGVKLSTPDVIELNKLIEKSYFTLNEKMSGVGKEDVRLNRETEDDVISTVLELCKSVQEQGQSDSLFYFIDLENFTEKFEEKGYEKQKQLEFRKWLKEKGYTRCANGRTSDVVRTVEKGKDSNVKRVVKVIKAKIDVHKEKESE